MVKMRKLDIYLGERPFILEFMVLLSWLVHPPLRMNIWRFFPFFSRPAFVMIMVVSLFVFRHSRSIIYDYGIYIIEGEGIIYANYFLSSFCIHLHFSDEIWVLFLFTFLSM